MVVWWFLAVLCIKAVSASLLPPLPMADTCTPTVVVQGPCHTCVCGYDGIYECKQLCTQYPPNTTRTNDASTIDELPEIEDGQSCIPGKTYKMECNICKCGMHYSLICTKKACIKKEDMEHFMAYRKSKQKVLGAKKKKEEGKSASEYPKIPKKGCIPGKIYSYRDNCNKCFCDELGQSTCTLQKCINSKMKNKVSGRNELTLENIRPLFSEKEVEKLPKLPNISTRCEPGKGYTIECNQCVCSFERVLICTQKYCLSFNDINRLTAKKLSGQPCDTDADIKKTECVECSCVKKTTKCERVENCKPSSFLDTEPRRLHGKISAPPSSAPGSKDTLALDPTENCIPGAVYTDKCNKCYCQEDGSLRCTQKACLNYVESLKLKRHRLYLEKHGL